MQVETMDTPHSQRTMAAANSWLSNNIKDESQKEYQGKVNRSDVHQMTRESFFSPGADSIIINSSVSDPVRSDWTDGNQDILSNLQHSVDQIIKRQSIPVNDPTSETAFSRNQTTGQHAAIAPPTHNPSTNHYFRSNHANLSQRIINVAGAFPMSCENLIQSPGARVQAPMNIPTTQPAAVGPRFGPQIELNRPMMDPYGNSHLQYNSGNIEHDGASLNTSTSYPMSASYHNLLGNHPLRQTSMPTPYLNASNYNHWPRPGGQGYRNMPPDSLPRNPHLGHVVNMRQPRMNRSVEYPIGSTFNSSMSGPVREEHMPNLYLNTTTNTNNMSVMPEMHNFSATNSTMNLCPLNNINADVTRVPAIPIAATYAYDNSIGETHKEINRTSVDSIGSKGLKNVSKSEGGKLIKPPKIASFNGIYFNNDQSQSAVRPSALLKAMQSSDSSFIHLIPSVANAASATQDGAGPDIPFNNNTAVGEVRVDTLGIEKIKPETAFSTPEKVKKLDSTVKLVKKKKSDKIKKVDSAVKPAKMKRTSEKVNHEDSSAEPIKKKRKYTKKKKVPTATLR